MINHIETLDTFDIHSLPNLDIAVLGALQLFQEQSVPHVDVSSYAHPLVVGSGNAEATGRIIFEDVDAVFASESNYEEKLRHIESIDEVIIVSASGGKHAPLIAKIARQYGKHVTLVTNTPHSPAAIALEGDAMMSELVFPKNREPYTYNTSTYMGMILGKTGEDPALIEQYIHEHIDSIQWPDFSPLTKYYVIVPPQFSNMVRMLQVKFIELFGRNIARDVETSEYVRHATTVAPSDELFICFGEPNETWGAPERRLNIPLPEGADYAAMMAISYYTISQIQNAHQGLFKDNILDYTAMVSKVFNETIHPVVDNK